MKYNNNYESVQNCNSGTELLHMLNGKYTNSIVPVEMNVTSADQECTSELSKSIIALNCDENKKSVSRKTCTCSSGMVPCPSHGDTDRSSINGYTNSFTNLPCNKTTKNTAANSKSRIDLKINTCKGEIAENNLMQCCGENGKVSKYKGIMTNGKKSSPSPRGNRLKDNVSSSRTFTIESTSPHHLNNCDSSKESLVPNKGDACVNGNLDELRLSLTSLISKDATAADEQLAAEAFQKWLTVKKRQEREIRQRESNLQHLIEQERRKKVQMEQENFLNWLHAKKMKEKQKRDIKKKALEEEQRKKNEKLKREEINKKQYQLWLKLKEEQDLVKKINEQKRKIEKEERERQRLERNQSAFQEWLISSKDKPKPVPLNRGLESLRTSTSVAFINPDPWVPNIVEKTKSHSK